MARLRPIDILVRLEWASVLVAAVIAYSWLGGSWLLFAVLLFAPDLAMVGYLANPRIGAIVYNAAHVVFGPLVLAGLGLVFALSWALPVALIWLAHIALDRTLGYGLKLASGFTQTHMGSIGRAAG